MEKKTVIRIEDLGKTYELGKIGRTTLQKSLQSWWAVRQGKEDPNRKIGQRIEEHGMFEALRHVSCEIYEGERVAIIGRNGAGKSTLLKLLSRVTAPTEGKICIRGKISSMLEVGTGFHGELTGRENIYLNGAILGMSQQEVSEQIEKIIEFSECEQFIDTPVKRYSSGMYVKLAFAVAAFLNADIFLMDEVLAVGDMMYQKKCLRKMREISEDENKTILYVSHNMQTIRELCNRCIVLQDGRIIHDGTVEEGIRIYMQDILEVKEVYEFQKTPAHKIATGNVTIQKIELDKPVQGSKDTALGITVHAKASQAIEGLHMRFTVYDFQDQVVGTSVSNPFNVSPEQNSPICFRFHTERLVEGEYSVDIALVEPFGGRQVRHAFLQRAIAFRVEKRERLYEIDWDASRWGSIMFANMEVSRLNG